MAPARVSRRRPGRHEARHRRGRRRRNCTRGRDRRAGAGHSGQRRRPAVAVLLHPALDSRSLAPGRGGLDRRRRPHPRPHPAHAPGDHHSGPVRPARPVPRRDSARRAPADRRLGAAAPVLRRGGGRPDRRAGARGTRGRCTRRHRVRARRLRERGHGRRGVPGRSRAGRSGSAHLQGVAAHAEGGCRGLRPPGVERGARPDAARRRTHLRGKAAGLPRDPAARDQRPSRQARAGRQAGAAAQGRRSVHLRARRGGDRDPRGPRNSVPGRARNHRGIGMRRLCGDPTDPSRSRPIVHFRHRSAQDRGRYARLGQPRPPQPDRRDLHGTRGPGDHLRRPVAPRTRAGNAGRAHRAGNHRRAGRAHRHGRHAGVDHRGEGEYVRRPWSSSATSCACGTSWTGIAPVAARNPRSSPAPRAPSRKRRVSAERSAPRPRSPPPRPASALRASAGSSARAA